MTKEAFDQLFTIVKRQEEEGEKDFDCIDYNWKRIGVKSKMTKELYCGVVGSPWNEQSDESRVQYHPDIFFAPVIPKPVLYTANVGAHYSLISVEDAKNAATICAHTPSIEENTLWSPVYLRSLSPLRATRMLSLALGKIRRHHVGPMGVKLNKEVVERVNKMKIESGEISLWNIYHDTFVLNKKMTDKFPNENPIADIFNALYSSLVFQCVSKQNFSPIEYHTVKGQSTPIWGGKGFILPKDSIFE